MLNLFRHSEEADLERILAEHAAIGSGASDHTDAHEQQFRDLLQALPAAIYTRKQAEERMMLRTQEVDHRSNNLLAVIQAMLRLTKADTAEEFQAAFQGRLSVLANVQRLFSVSRWTGASLKSIIEEELRPYGSNDTQRVSIRGSDVRLPAALAHALPVSA